MKRLVSDKPKVRYEKVEINGKITRRKVHCACTTGHTAGSYNKDPENPDSWSTSPTAYFNGPDYREQCPTCRRFRFYFKEGGPKENAKYLQRGK